ncbi:NrfD/PsrC family molybdoenzyme membrane anchor subunit [Halodurantibacterium flavum]|uniref:NrfD/PsrC family molybdoenzyme membrane anchor subunit n=1 Tax=Halodurantibacterium flavum TaxID=1382802 RepID=A0ABW4S0B8_9RHOB
MNYDPLRPYDGETYHGMPAVKASHWDWTVSSYIFLAGLGGGAQALATIAHASDPARFGPMRRNARFLGTLGSSLGALLLIKDLKTPRRFHHMFRIFRPTSPMSFGTYILSKFGALSAFASLGELLPRIRPLRPLTEAAQMGAAVTGTGAATYTASLLSATSNPHWAATPRALGVKFAASSMALAAAALAMGERIAGRDRNARPLEAVAMLSTLVQFIAGLRAKKGRDDKGVGPAMKDSAQEKMLTTADTVLAGAVPLGLYMLSRGAGGHARGLALAASATVLVGGFLVRHATLYAGHEAARRPRAHLSLARPENLGGDDRG